MNFIVTAGGQGTKIWPMSREHKPKQFQNIVGQSTLYRRQIQSLLKAYSPDKIFISTKAQYVKYVQEQSPEIPEENIIIEPEYKKNRGPGEGYAFLKLADRKPNEPFMIIQSDVIREPEEKFLEMIAVAEELQIKHRKMITAGQKATSPSLGIDYLRLGSQISEIDNIDVYYIDEFIERLDDYEKTKNLVQNFHISTHANHLCWFPELILDAYEKYRPDWFEALMKIRDSFGKEAEKSITDEIYKNMQEGATEEVTRNIMNSGEAMLILTPFRWIDVGTWSSIYDELAIPGENYIDGEVIAIDTERTLIKGPKGKLITALGIEDLVIVDTEDALLVMRKEKAGDIKTILKKLEEEGKESFL
ncbi:MAG: hypothetical protein Kow0081_3360 [Candidatus Dojkabacteria bacterium]